LVTHFSFAALIVVQASPQTIDRLVAVVGNDPIFLSDVREVVRLRLLNPLPGLTPIAAEDPSPEGEALARLINRRLILAEVARYSQAPPAPADVDAAVSEWAARFEQPPPHDAALVRAFLVDTLRIDRYINQRFTAAAQPTREEVRAYYQANLASFVQAQVMPSFEAAEEEARRRLAEERRVTMVREWLRGLRERAQVRTYR
jgi:hypothetical protein